jgi:hypothetical protein
MYREDVTPLGIVGGIEVEASPWLGQEFTSQITFLAVLWIDSSVDQPHSDSLPEDMREVVANRH